MFGSETETDSAFSILHNVDHGSGHPPFLHRSISAPAIAEHVSDAILPEYDDFDNDSHNIDASYYNNHPSRLNPRMPKPVRAFHHNDPSDLAGFEPGGFFEDGNQKSILGSLIMDNKPMTPVDKIQEDFPSTPSAVYSTRLTKIKEVDEETPLKPDESLNPAPILTLPLTGIKTLNSDQSSSGVTPSPSLGHIPHAPSPHLEMALDQASISLQNIYVSGGYDENLLVLQQGVTASSSTNLPGQSPEVGPNNGSLGLRHTSRASHNQIQNSQHLYNNASNVTLSMSGTPSMDGLSMGMIGGVNNVAMSMALGAMPVMSNGMISDSSQQHFMRSQVQMQPSQSQGMPPQSMGIMGNGHPSHPSGAPASMSMQLPMPLNYGSAAAQMNHLTQPQLMQLQLQQASGHGQTAQTGHALAQPQHYYLHQQAQMQVPSSGGQTVYVDPVFYRVQNGSALGIYQQELMYGSSVDQVNVGVNVNPQDQQVSFIQYQSPPGSYWSNASGQPIQLPVGMQGVGVGEQQLVLVSPGNVPMNNGRADVGMIPVSRRGVPVPMYSQQQNGANMNNIIDQSNSMRPFMSGSLQVQGGVQMMNPGVQIRQPQPQAHPHLMNGVGVSLSPPPMILSGSNGNSHVSLQKMNGGGPSVNVNLMYMNKQATDQGLSINGSPNNIVQSPDSPTTTQYNNSLSHSVNISMGVGSGTSSAVPAITFENGTIGVENDGHRYSQSNSSGSVGTGIESRPERNTGKDKDKDRDRNVAANRQTDRNRPQSNASNGSGNTVRDQLVEEFRNTYGKSRQWELKDLLGHVVAFCQDQHGSRFIQQRLEVANDPEKQLIFDEVMPHARDLMTDVFGNYVIQKLFEYGSPDQIETLASLISGQAVPLALQMYGCRVIQKALEYVGTPRLVSLVSEFEGSQVLRCVHDQNGNHVIQKCIEVVSRVAKEAVLDVAEYLNSRIQFIIMSFHGRVRELSMHPYGCRVVQRILEHCNNQQKSSLLEELRHCCTDLVQDQYGNYVIQHVMQHGWEADRAILVKEVQEHLLDFSQHKFASNVVEKCLQYASKKDRDEMIWTIIKVTFDLNNPVDAKTGHCVLESMVRDPYANYVVQKVIDVSDERQRGAIMKYVKENIVQLRRYTYGKHIIVRLEKVSGEKF